MSTVSGPSVPHSADVTLGSDTRRGLAEELRKLARSRIVRCWAYVRFDASGVKDARRR